MIRVFGFGICVVFVGAVLGCLIGTYVAPSSDGGVFGSVIGMSSAACARLWLMR
jgi:hypothetical protein